MNKKIALTGPYNENTRRVLYETVPEGFEIYDVRSPEEYAKLADADYIIIRTIKLNGADLAESAHLKAIQKWGAGYDSLDIQSISAKDIPVLVCSGVNAEPVAEMAVLHMLAVLRNLLPMNACLKQNQWCKDEFASKSWLLAGKTVGLVGLGNIGRKVAHIVQGFDAKVQYYDVFRISEEEEKRLGIQYISFEKLLRTSDIVSMHVPLMDATRNMIGEQQLAMMKPTAILINTSRGGVVDEKALAKALQEHAIMGAGLDAFSQEPPGMDCPFYQMENVVITPHSGGNTVDNDLNMIRRCFENIQNLEKGEAVRRRDVVNNDKLSQPVKTV